MSLLRAVLGERMQSPVEQSLRLWDQLTGATPLDLDEQGRLRLGAPSDVDGRPEVTNGHHTGFQCGRCVMFIDRSVLSPYPTERRAAVHIGQRKTSRQILLTNLRD